jgi:peroxin-19
VKSRFQNLPFKCNLQRYTAGMGSLGLPPKKKAAGAAGGAAGAAGAGAAAAFNPYAGMFGGGGNPYAGGFGGNPYGGMGEMGGGQDPFGDELSDHMSRMFAGGEDAQQANLQQTLAALNGQTAGGAAGMGGGGGGGGGGGEEEMMKQMMEAMSGGAGGMQEMMDNMLQHLLSKETLYEPMVEISQKYPPWIKKNRKALPDEEIVRYEAQLVKVCAIIQAFDEGEKDFAKIVTLLQEMQAFGLPPDEIMKELSQNKNAPLGPDGKPQGFPGFPGAGGMPGMPGMGAGGAPPECTIM